MIAFVLFAMFCGSLFAGMAWLFNRWNPKPLTPPLDRQMKNIRDGKAPWAK